MNIRDKYKVVKKELVIRTMVDGSKSYEPFVHIEKPLFFGIKYVFRYGLVDWTSGCRGRDTTYSLYWTGNSQTYISYIKFSDEEKSMKALDKSVEKHLTELQNIENRRVVKIESKIINN
jgi:hypothetical protein